VLIEQRTYKAQSGLVPLSNRQTPQLSGLLHCRLPSREA
jgi:hypothetical protein